MRRRRCTHLAALVAVAALVTLTACGDDGGTAADVDRPTTTASPAPPEPDPTVAPGPPPRLTAVDLGLEVESPIDLTARPDSTSLLIAERGGRVVEAVADGDGGFRAADRPVIDLTERVGSTDGEKGLLGIAVSPDGSVLYASYTEATNGDSRIDAYPLSGRDGSLRADPGGRRELVAIEQPFPNHNGGSLVVDDRGLLYAGFGDGGAANDIGGRAQDPTDLLGKILRLDPQGVEDANGDGVPDSNPFVEGATPPPAFAAEPQIWSTGLRNPWRMSIDPATGDLWVGDVGQGRWEEVTVLRAADGTGRGANLGWDLFEGTEAFSDADPAPGAASAGPFAAPVHVYSHDDGGCSVTGGYVYRGEDVPALQGTYLFGDFCLPGVRGLRTGPDGSVEVTDLGAADVGGVVSFGRDARGELYVLNLDGTVARLEAA